MKVDANSKIWESQQETKGVSLRTEALLETSKPFQGKGVEEQT